MSAADLHSLERDVVQARERLKSNLDVLRAPGTFAGFKDQVSNEARQSYDDAVAKGKAAATNWSELLISEIKERAAANPVAVAAIAAGIGWRILRKPPITTMLVGYGLYSLYQTKPGELAPGGEAVYQATDAALRAKEQVQQWSGEASEAVGQASDIVVPAVADAVQRLTAGASEMVAGATESVQALAQSGSERVARLSANAGPLLAEATSSARSVAASGAKHIGHLVMDEEQRNNALLATAAGALTLAIGFAWLRAK